MNILSLHIKPCLLAAMALLVPLLSLLFIVLAGTGALTLLSEKDLIEAYRAQQPGLRRPLYYLNYRPVSATFYSRGRAGILSGSGADLPREGFWLAVHQTEGDASAWQCELRFQAKRGIFDLYLCQ